MCNRRLVLLCLAVLMISGCTASPPQVNPTTGPSDATISPAAEASPSPTATITPTPEPRAAEVNGRPITLAAYEAELQRYQSAAAEMGATVEPEQARQAVLDALVQEQLLAQAAEENNFRLTEEELDARLQQVIAEMGGEPALESWLSANQYTRDSFLQALALSAAASWQRDQILSSIPEEVEQVHARQLFVLSSAEAEGLYRQLQAGTSFDDLIQRYDPLTGGELGWFPRGYLTQPLVEETAFSMQPGEYSNVIQTELGFHIIEVLEHEQAPLSPNARQALGRKTLTDWLAERQASANIQIFVP